MKKMNKFFYYVIITAVLLLFLSPFYLVLLTSLKSNKEIITNSLALPIKISFEAYKKAFEKMNYLKSFGNSIYITTLSVTLILLFSSMCAYIFARKHWKINNIIFMIMVASMIIPFQAIMIPLVRNFAALNIMNNLNTIILFYCGASTPMAVFMFHGFIKNIPLELEEAASIDGCTQYGVFFKIVVPLLKPIGSTILILNALGLWNDFLFPFIVIKSKNLRTLPLTTYIFAGQYATDYALTTAGLVLTIVPIIILYLFMQKHIIEGVSQGAIK